VGPKHVAASSLVVLVLVTLAVGVSVALAVGAGAPTPLRAYSNGVAGGVGKTSVQIDVNRAANRVTTLLSCYQKHGVQVQADNGASSYRLHDGAFSFNKTYEVDKLIPDNGETVQETGHGKVLLTGRFTNGEFIGKVQIHFAGFRNLHLGGGCRKTSYVARLEVAG
jgi:hypothetical protein